MSCHTCGSKANPDVTSLGTTLEAGYHSRYDTNRYIWLHPDYQPDGNPDYCDDCIDQMVADRKIEAIFSECNSHLDTPSEEALREIFADRAQRSHTEWRKSFPGWTPTKTPGTEWLDQVTELRTLITGDTTYRKCRGHTFPTQNDDSFTASKIGQVHAISAGMLGATDKDPDFRIAAAAWAKARTEYRKEADRIFDDFLTGIEETHRELNETLRSTFLSRVSCLVSDLRHNVDWNIFRR